MLTTPRLILRPWRPEDLEPFARINADPEVMRFYPAPLTLQETRQTMERIEKAVLKNGFCWWAVERPGTDPFIGFIGLNVPTFQAHFTPCVEIGWRLAREHWGQGLAPEGARAALEYAFGSLGLPEVVAFTARQNAPSRRVMEKVGMTRDPGDDFRHPLLARDHPLSEHVLYRIKPMPSRP